MSSNVVKHGTDASRRRLKSTLAHQIANCRRRDWMNIPASPRLRPARARVSRCPFQPPRGRLPTGVPFVFNVAHPSWIQRQHDDQLEYECKADLAAAIRWCFDRLRSARSTPASG